MNLPNSLSVLRIILSPIFLIVFFLSQGISVSPAPVYILLFILYAVMELTDLLDGYIARSRNLITDLGKVLDPFADVLARMTYFLCFTAAGIMPVWILAVLIYRELGITFLRTLLFREGIAVPASIWGKSKAVLYSLSGLAGMLYLLYASLAKVPEWAGKGLFVIFILSALASVGSFVTYIPPIIKSRRKEM